MIIKRISGFKGKTHTEESKRKIRQKRKLQVIPREVYERIVESRKWYKHSEETKKKIGRNSKALTGRKRSKESIIKQLETRKKNGCNVFTEEHKTRISESRKGFKMDPLVVEKIAEKKRGIKLSSETKRKMRIAACNRVLLNFGKFASYSKQACEFFKSFDEKHNTKGRYAMYGGGEYYVKGLGYWVDYYNPELKLIMEYDEPHHYENGKLREKDVARQEEIKKYFIGFEFKRIKQEDINNGV